MSPSPIIKRITRFGRSESCFERCVCPMPFYVEWTEHWEKSLNCQTFSVLLNVKRNLAFHSCCSMKGGTIVILWKSILICSRFSATAIAYWNQLSSIFFGFLYAFLILIHLGKSMYDPSRLMLILLQINIFRKHNHK